LFSTDRASALPVGTMLIIIPIYIAIWRWEGNDNQRLDNFFDCNRLNSRSSRVRAFFSTKRFLDLATPSIGIILGISTHCPFIIVIGNFETTWGI